MLLCKQDPTLRCKGWNWDSDKWYWLTQQYRHPSATYSTRGIEDVLNNTADVVFNASPITQVNGTILSVENTSLFGVTTLTTHDYVYNNTTHDQISNRIIIESVPLSFTVDVDGTSVDLNETDGLQVNSTMLINGTIPIDSLEFEPALEVEESVFNASFPDLVFDIHPTNNMLFSVSFNGSNIRIPLHIGG